MNTTLLSNRELEDYTNDDSFNFKVKADAIKLFLEYNTLSLEKNKMLVLYGDWGSGKTSLMRHIEKDIDKDIYYPIFFQAWEHEKDENLPLSLCDALITHVENNNPIIDNFIKGAFTTLKSFTNGMTLKTSGILSGLGIDFELSGEKINEAIDKALQTSSPKSFYKSNKEFKESFRNIEDSILKKHNAQKLLIFVDDLDRCEPENVLNLITALKLFFTYGDKCVFLCGIDKDAVTKAVRTRYKDVIKSEEYMEKVFDIAFNMPKISTLKKILVTHFYDIKIGTKTSVKLVEDFFNEIHFTNPRHLKKVINKYLIVKSFKESLTLPNEYQKLIPNIITSNNNGKVFETILTLFTIVLYEFYEIEFSELENYEQKALRYTEIVLKTRGQGTREDIKRSLNMFMYIGNRETASFNNILNSSRRNDTDYGFVKFILLFSNTTPNSLDSISDETLSKYSEYFIDNRITTNFCKFLIKHKKEILEEFDDSYYNIPNLFDMVKYLL